MNTYIVDAFTRTPFTGNPAAVCFPGQRLTDTHMQHIATEFGLSETAFVTPAASAGTYAIRYFSPKQEILLCGHATLASAKVLFARTDLNDLVFITVEKLELRVRRQGDQIAMEFPVYETEPVDVPQQMLQALGLRTIVNSAYSPKNKIILLQIDDTRVLAALRPNFTALVASYSVVNGVLLTAESSDGAYDYHYRYFWPWAGTNEDPVTGGVQTFLAKYWSQRLNKKSMRAFQSSMRTGSMTVELSDNAVLLCSDAVVVMEGTMTASMAEECGN